MDVASRGDAGCRMQGVAVVAGGIASEKGHFASCQRDGDHAVDPVILIVIGPYNRRSGVAVEVIPVQPHRVGCIDPERHGKTSVKHRQPIVESLVWRRRVFGQTFPAVEQQRLPARNGIGAELSLSRSPPTAAAADLIVGARRVLPCIAGVVKTVVGDERMRLLRQGARAAAKENRARRGDGMERQYPAGFDEYFHSETELGFLALYLTHTAGLSSNFA